MLFHYHFWTPFLEETEKFYVENGFRITQRIGKYEGDFHEFNPPMQWDDFREKNILFRIIEVRKGQVNITFGYGKKVTFDHIGFLVSINEQNKICANAEKLNWVVARGDRRTFITTPYKFRVELQTNSNVVDDINDPFQILELKLETIKKGLENDLSILFDHPINEITSVVGDRVTIKKATINSTSSFNGLDPNGVTIKNTHDSNFS